MASTIAKIGARSAVQDVDIKALFLGDKAENAAAFKQFLNQLVDDHIGWRQNYLPADHPAISQNDQDSPAFISTNERIAAVLAEVSQRMRSGSIPWNSAGRYWGQMNSETLMPSILAYSFAMLWNPNNVALESSMATSQMEAEIAEDFAKLFGFSDGWGHLSADGSIANLEGIWYARCIKSIPLAIKEVRPDLVQDKSDWDLLNLSVEQILDLVERLSNGDANDLDRVKAASSRSGRNLAKLGKWIVPETKHYSWLKAADIVGIGLDQLVSVPVKHNYRMDVAALESTVRQLAASKTPILGVVTVVGTTEEGAVDEVDKIVALREELKAEGVYFYIHCDAAYGGYARSLFIDEDGEFCPSYEQLKPMHDRHNVFSYDVTIAEDVYNGFKGISDVESVTIDPHKMGYVPYSAGGIAIKHKAMRNVISYFAPYVFEKGVQAPDLLGAFILEGSKAGATAAGVWTAHQILPLNVTGYGKLVGTTIEAAHRFRDFLTGLSFAIGNRVVRAYPLNMPDFNMVDWVFKADDMTSLAEVNRLNEQMYDYASYLDGPVYRNRFITSHTSFARDDYGDSVLPFLKQLGFDTAEWEKTGSLTLLRAAIMTPYMNDDDLFSLYSSQIADAMKRKLAEALAAAD